MKQENIIAYKNGMISKEELPKAIVLYPGFYGSFFGFKDTIDSEILLCECSRTAIENYISFRLKHHRYNAIPERNFILNSMYFPISLVRELMQDNTIQEEHIMNKLKFAPNLCHECNKQVPLYKYCIPMYGGLFKQTYGWYINKQALEMGIEPISSRILFDKVSDELLDLIKIDPEEIWNDVKAQEIYNKAFEEKQKIYADQNKEIWKVIENEVRRKFGFKNIGESWANETLVYQIMKQLFPNDEILFHYRSAWLSGLEIDIFNATKNIGIEYQGIQHYKPIDHWGGEDALKRTKGRDKRKKMLCEKNDTKLIYITYLEDVSKELVIKKIAEKI